MGTTASDRVQVRSQGELMHPGACALCGSGNCDEGYVDLGVYYDYEGQVYLCMNCVAQVIHTVNGLTGEEAEFLKVIHNDLAKENARLTEELQVANERNAKWTDLISEFGGSSITADSLTDATINLVPENESSVSSSPEVPEQGPVGVKPESVKPVEGKRPPKSSKSTGANSTEFNL